MKQKKVSDNSIIWAALPQNGYTPLTPEENEVEELKEKKQKKIKEVEGVAKSNPAINFTKNGIDYTCVMEAQDVVQCFQNAINDINNNIYTVDLALKSNNNVKQLVFKASEKANILNFLYEKITEISINTTRNINTNQYLYCGRQPNAYQTLIGNNTKLIFNNVIENNGILYNTTTGKFNLQAGLVYEIFCNGLFTVTQKPTNTSMTGRMILASDQVAEATPTAGYIFIIDNSSNISLNDGFIGTFKTLFSPTADGEFYVIMKGGNDWKVQMDWQSTLIVNCIGTKRNIVDTVNSEVGVINALTTVEDVEAYTTSISPINIVIPENFIESVLV